MRKPTGSRAPEPLHGSGLCDCSLLSHATVPLGALGPLRTPTSCRFAPFTSPEPPSSDFRRRRRGVCPPLHLPLPTPTLSRVGLGSSWEPGLIPDSPSPFPGSSPILRTLPFRLPPSPPPLRSAGSSSSPVACSLAVVSRPQAARDLLALECPGRVGSTLPDAGPGTHCAWGVTGCRTCTAEGVIALFGGKQVRSSAHGTLTVSAPV